MKSPIRIRLTGFLATVAFGAVLIGWTERHAWRQTDRLQKRLDATKWRSNPPAKYIEGAILRLNNTLIRFDLREDPNDRIRFQQDANGLKTLLAQHRTGALSSEERELLRQIELAFHDYLTKAFQILDQSAQTPGSGSTAALFERAEIEVSALLALAAPSYPLLKLTNANSAKWSPI